MYIRANAQAFIPWFHRISAFAPQTYTTPEASYSSLTALFCSRVNPLYSLLLRTIHIITLHSFELVKLIRNVRCPSHSSITFTISATICLMFVSPPKSQHTTTRHSFNASVAFACARILLRHMVDLIRFTRRIAFVMILQDKNHAWESRCKTVSRERQVRTLLFPSYRTTWGSRLPPSSGPLGILFDFLGRIVSDSAYMPIK